MDSKKSNKISDIVRLQQILKKWRKFAKTSKDNRSSNEGSCSSKSMKFLKRTLSLSDNLSIREAQTTVVPKGYLAVCVGEEMKRFVIPTEYLGHHAFHALLREAEEEFGFQQTGVLRFPCEVSLFETILKMVEHKEEGRLDVEDRVGCCPSETPIVHPCHHHSQSPMCR